MEWSVCFSFYCSAHYVSFQVEFDFTAGVLTVHILKCEDLPVMDLGGLSDPYVKLYLLPERKRKYETKVHRKTLNPVFNETFKFEVCKIPNLGILVQNLVRHPVTLPPGSIWGGDDQDPRFRRVRLRPLFQTRRHWRGSSSSLSNGLGTSQRNLERTPEHCGRRKSKIHQMFSFFLFLLSQASSFSTSIFSLSRQKKKGNFGFVPETSFGPFGRVVQMGNFASVC